MSCKDIPRGILSCFTAYSSLLFPADLLFLTVSWLRLIRKQEAAVVLPPGLCLSYTILLLVYILYTNAKEDTVYQKWGNM